MFSSKPNFGTYALLCIWVSEIDATTFLKKIHFLTTINLEALNHSPFLHAAEAHGKWDGRQPLFLMPLWL
jgi:hypothetical protein